MATIQKVRTIRLYGKLGALFGRVHKLAVNSPAEAVRALGVLYPGFNAFLSESKSKGLAFAVFIGKSNLDVKQLHNPPGKEDIRIAPVAVGRKSGGIFMAIVGVVLIVVGAMTSNPALMMAGAGMLFGGVMMMNTQQQKGLGTDDKAANRPSYNFNGAVNTEAQGHCVPLAYGENMVGSAVISAGIYTEDQA
jgi:predicted phage tail protein